MKTAFVTFFVIYFSPSSRRQKSNKINRKSPKKRRPICHVSARRADFNQIRHVRRFWWHEVLSRSVRIQVVLTIVYACDKAFVTFLGILFAIVTCTSPTEHRFWWFVSRSTWMTQGVAFWNLIGKNFLSRTILAQELLQITIHNAHFHIWSDISF